MKTSRLGTWLLVSLTLLVLGCSGCSEKPLDGNGDFYFKTPYFSQPCADASYAYFMYNNGIYRKPLEGGETELVVGNARFPAISKDGSMLAYAEPYTSLSVVNLGTGGTKQVDSSDVVSISWMGDSLVYGRWPGEIWSANIDGCKTRLISQGWDPESMDSGFAFVFMRYRSNIDLRISWLLRYSDGEEVELAELQGDYRHPSVSPDGKSIALSAVHSFSVAVYEIETGTLTTVIERAFEPSYTVDSRLMFVHLSADAEENGQIWICDPDGSNQELLVQLSDVQ